MALTHTPAEAAALIGASEDFLRTKARHEEIPHLRVGRRKILFTDEHIAQIIEALSVPATQKTSRLTSPRARKRAA
jgi:excisionase family DNA binding protein